MLRKNKKSKEQTDQSLALPAANGETAMIFSEGLVEQIRYMLARIQQDTELPKKLALTAALRSEGVTHTAYALSAVMAHDMAVRVCLVDLNWWWPYSSPLALDEPQGLAGVLQNGISLDDALVASHWTGLSLLPAGKLDRSLRPVMARSKELKDIMDQLSQKFEYLILDIPAILATSDAVSLAGLADACCLVVQHGTTAAEDSKGALDEIRHLPMLGVILNRSKFATPAPLLRLLAAR